MKKKVLATLLAATMVFSLAACGGKKDEGKQATAGTVRPRQRKSRIKWNDNWCMYAYTVHLSVGLMTEITCRQSWKQRDMKLQTICGRSASG